METLTINPRSLYGRAIFIRNQMRGGISSDDDSYPIPMLQQSVVSVSAEIMQQDLNQQFTSGQSAIDTTFLRREILNLTRDNLVLDQPVVLLRTPLPQSLSWNNNPAISYIQGLMGDEFAMAVSQRDAISKAMGKGSMLPAGIAYWFDAQDLRLAAPLKSGTIRKLAISYVPSQLDKFNDGSIFDEFEDEFPLPERLWEAVWTTVLNRVGNNLLKTSPNRDEINNGADTTTTPK